MKPFRTGLVVGKFAPLHHGHQLLLDEADRACEEVVILSYSKPEFEGYGPARRERWLRRLYPRAKVHVLDDARLAEACDARSVARVELPANDASDDVHRRFVAPSPWTNGGRRCFPCARSPRTQSTPAG